MAKILSSTGFIFFFGSYLADFTAYSASSFDDGLLEMLNLWEEFYVLDDIFKFLENCGPLSYQTYLGILLIMKSSLNFVLVLCMFLNIFYKDVT